MKEYTVTLNGTETTIQIADDDLEQYPDAKPVKKAAPAPENKARSASNKKG